MQTFIPRCQALSFAPLVIALRSEILAAAGHVTTQILYDENKYGGWHSVLIVAVTNVE